MIGDSPDSLDESQIGKTGATASVAPSPIQQGPITFTHPVASGSGLRAGKTYRVTLEGGYDETALQSIGVMVTTDKTGGFQVALTGDPPDTLLVGPTSTLNVYADAQGGTTSYTALVASSTLQITPAAGTAAITPQYANPGTTLAVSGTGAQPGAALKAEWYDSTGCSCWYFGGCSGCTRTLDSVDLTADASGNYSGSLTPSAQNNGYCVQELSIIDHARGIVVATTDINFCPYLQH
jgi:hypothetical protein